MKLIIGGAYQGKLSYACNSFHLAEEDIFSCTSTEIDFSRRCIDSIEEFVFACTKYGIDPVEYFTANKGKWEHSILICQDIFCGVVPMEPELRKWRQACGRLCQYLAANAESVTRIFCGLEQQLK